MPMRPTIRAIASGSTGIRRHSALVALVAILVATLLLAFTTAASAQPSPSPPIAPSATASASATAAPGALPSAAPASPSAPDGATMQWEYRTLFVTWDTTILDWVADFSDGTRIEGLDTILNNEGVNGWELVAVVPELWTQVVDDAIREDARRLRIFLKKPRV
jgi:hypothetical protein